MRFYIGLVLMALMAVKAEAFEIKSAAFGANGYIPKKYTCDGGDASPEISWSNLPKGTKSLALIMDDPDAPVGTWVHWVLYDLSANLNKLEEGILKKKTVVDAQQSLSQGLNDFKKVGYNGPCPPRGSPHRYFFKLYALDEFLGLKPGKVAKTQLLKAMEGHVLGQAELVGLYKR